MDDYTAAVVNRFSRSGLYNYRIIRARSLSDLGGRSEASGKSRVFFRSFTA